MQWSTERILTTHTGSLPRPPELTRLYVRRTRGETIDEQELDRLGKAALDQIIDKQVAAGVDIGNNGEQQREAFFLYVRRRMTGFGSSWTRWPRGDVERYPLLKAEMRQMLAGARSGVEHGPAQDDRPDQPISTRTRCRRNAAISAPRSTASRAASSSRSSLRLRPGSSSER